jgi:hypothetical protein
LQVDCAQPYAAPIKYLGDKMGIRRTNGRDVFIFGVRDMSLFRIFTRKRSKSILPHCSDHLGILISAKIDNRNGHEVWKK